MRERVDWGALEITPVVYGEDGDIQSNSIKRRMLENVRGCLAGALLLVSEIEDADADLVLAVAAAHNAACKALDE